MLSRSVHGAGRCTQFVKDCEARFPAETRCSTEERDKKLQVYYIDVGDVEVVCGPVLFSRLAMDKEPEGWKQVHVGGIDGISCQRSCCRNTGSGRKTGGRTCGMAGKRDPRCTWLAWTSRRPSTWQDQSVLRNLWAIKLFTDGLQRPYCEKWQAWQDRQHLNMLKTIPFCEMHPSGER